jgi:uncharacterized membrane protein YphA (DoxX/SURF4 family)
MARWHRAFDRIDRRITGWMAVWGILLLRISVGVVFLWFGALKLFPGMSPAEKLAADTIAVVTFGLLDAGLALRVLAVWEMLIGLGLISGLALRATLLLLFVQMPGTVMPLIFFPEVAFRDAPFVLTMEGQYIIKNLVLVSAGLVIGATVRGGGLVTQWAGEGPYLPRTVGGRGGPPPLRRAGRGESGEVDGGA